MQSLIAIQYRSKWVMYLKYLCLIHSSYKVKKLGHYYICYFIDDDNYKIIMI